MREYLSTEFCVRAFQDFCTYCAKWFLPPHWQHQWPHVGHLPFSNGWIPPQKREDFCDLMYLSFLSGFLLLLWWRNFSHFSFTRLTSTDVFAPEITFICYVFVSELLQMSMYLLSMSFQFLRKSFFLFAGFGFRTPTCHPLKSFQNVSLLLLGYQWHHCESHKSKDRKSVV